MKKLSIILIITLTVISTFGQMNVYHPFPDSNAMWTDRIYDPYCDMINLLCSINQYTITGDTLISGKLYKKITNSGYIVSQNNEYVYYSLYAGAIRQEINNKKVFYFPPYGYPQVDTLLYDFNLEVGDSLPLSYLYPFNSCDAVIDAIDSIAVGNSYHKRFRISTTYGPPLDTTWLIEGIGCSRGLFGYYCPGWEHWQDLTCFIQNDSLIYPYDNTDCDLITFISEPDDRPNAICIFPDPIKDKFTIEVSPVLANTRISISDIGGQELFERQITDRETEIDIGNFSGGVYFLRLKNNSTVAIKKIIKE